MIRKCFIDYEREIALVVLRTHPETGEQELLAMGRLTRQQSSRKAEVAVLVSDQYQHGGLGKELLRRLIEVARGERLEEILAILLSENLGMRALARRFDFQIVPGNDPTEVTAVLKL